MRVLQVVPELDVNAGMTNVVMNYYRQISSDCCQFDFLYFRPSKASFEAEIHQRGGRTIEIAPPSHAGALLHQLRAFFSENAERYDAIHCHPLWSPVAISMTLGSAAQTPVIAHCHSTQYSEKRFSAIRNKAMLPMIRRSATAFAACSEEAMSMFRLKPETPAPQMVLPNAIEVEAYRFSESDRENTRVEFGIDKDTFVIGQVGRFSPEKNHAWTLEVFARFVQLHPNAKLLLPGDGALREQLVQKAQALGIRDWVLFCGRRSDMPRIYAAMDVLIMPSLFEGVPVSAVEAQASGLPCLLSDTITKEVQMGLCNYYSLERKPEEWVEQIVKLSANTQNRAALNAKLVGSQYDIRKQAERLVEFYRFVKCKGA